MIIERSWFTDIANFKVVGVIPKEYNEHPRRKFFRDASQFVWDDPHLFKIGVDGLLRRCIFGEEVRDVLWHCHDSPYRGHFNVERTTTKILQA